MDDENEDVALLEEAMEKTFWQRFFVQLLFFFLGGFFAYLLTVPLVVGIYGWANAPSITYKTIVRDPYDNKCMNGIPATVVRKKVIRGRLDDWSVITLKYANQPTYICKFLGDTLYNDWQIGEEVFHDGGERE